MCTTRYCPRPPTRWNVAIAATGRCKRVCTGSAARSVERVELPWTCSENRAPKAEITPLGRYTRHAGDTHDTESLLQCRFSRPNSSRWNLKVLASEHPPGADMEKIERDHEPLLQMLM